MFIFHNSIQLWAAIIVFQCREILLIKIETGMIAVQYMRKGTVYRVRNRKTNTYMTSGAEVTMSPLQDDKIAQLWLFDEIKPTLYEIVSMQSGQVLTRRETLTIEKGNWLGPQLWKLERAEMNQQENYFWIISSEDESQYLFASSLSPKVSIKNFDNTLFVSNWQMREVDLDKDLAGCCVFRSEFSNLVIDVPQASNKEGIGIIQYTFNGRGNQRWVLQKVLDSYVIRNLCSNMILCPHNRTLKTGTKIIQSQFANKNEQKWIFEQEGVSVNKFSIKNKGDPSLYLGVCSSKESGTIQLTGEKEKGVWILQGSYLQLLNP